MTLLNFVFNPGFLVVPLCLHSRMVGQWFDRDCDQTPQARETSILGWWICLWVEEHNSSSGPLQVGLSFCSLLGLFVFPLCMGLSLRIGQECVISLGPLLSAASVDSLIEKCAYPNYACNLRIKEPLASPIACHHPQSHWAWARPTIPDQVSSQQQQPASPYELWSPDPANLPDNWAGQGMGAAPGKNSTNSHSSQQKFSRFSSTNISQIVSCLYSISRALKWLFLFIVSNFIFAFLKRGFVDLLTWP